jgi:hypothetical protein
MNIHQHAEQSAGKMRCCCQTTNNSLISINLQSTVIQRYSYHTGSIDMLLRLLPRHGNRMQDWWWEIQVYLVILVQISVRLEVVTDSVDKNIFKVNASFGYPLHHGKNDPIQSALPLASLRVPCCEFCVIQPHSGSMSYHKLKTNTKHITIVQHGLWTIRYGGRDEKKSERWLLGATRTTVRDQIYRSSMRSPQETFAEQLYTTRYANCSGETVI